MPTDDEISASVREFMNRQTYSAFDRATLASIPDDKVELAIQDFVFGRIGRDFSREQTVLDQLSPGFNAIYTTLHLEAEVCNGGFNQYFWNSEGRLAARAAQGFLHIGAPEYADLMNRAIECWKAEEATSEPFRETGTLEAFSESYEHTKLGELDDEFFELLKISDLSQLRVAFIRVHPEEFFISPEPRK